MAELRDASRIVPETVCLEAGRSVLIVDDEPGVRNLMRRWLESRGFTVFLASDADQALQVPGPRRRQWRSAI